MQNAPSGRRYALVPGTATPSPELAQRLLERTIDQPLDILSLDQKFEPPAGGNAALVLNSKSASMNQEAGGGPFSWTCGETPGHQNHQRLDSGRKDLGPGGFKLGSHEKIRRRSSLRACKAHRTSLGNRRDKKRKHATSAQDHGRRYSQDVSEDIPHMSEIDSDDGMKPAYKDVFGSRGHRSLVTEVRAAVFRKAGNADSALLQPTTTNALDIPRSYEGPYSTPSICGVSPRDTSLGACPPFWGC